MIKPQTHRILEHADADPGDVPAVGDVLTRTAGGEWDAQPGGAGGGPHGAAQHNAATLPGGFAESFGAAFFDQDEIAAPATPAANAIRAYSRDKVGVSEWFYKNDAGAERDLSAGGHAQVHDHTTGDGSGVLTADEHDSYSEFAETAAPATPAANKARLWWGDDAGVTRPFVRDEGGLDVPAFAVVRPRMYFLLPPGGQAFNNMPAAETEFLGVTYTRQRADLTVAREARMGLRVVTAGAAGAALRIKGSPDDTLANFIQLSSAAGGGDVLIDTVGTKLSAWFAIAAANKTADRFLSLFAIGGDGVADPLFGAGFLEFR